MPSSTLAFLSLLSLSYAKLKFGGVNIAGFDFGCDTSGDCTASAAYPPFLPYGNDGPGQMQHFVRDDGLNAFRLPVSWQYLVYNQLGAPINTTQLSEYDKLVNACVSAGAKLCLIDIHNYARWNGGIIGQGGPTNEQFANFWGQLAAHYASNPVVAFGIMNEPHDLDIQLWAGTVQAAVTAIRNSGANQIALLPGTDYTSAEQFVSSGAAAALNQVKNPDGTTTNLVMDVHKYLDSDGSGTSSTCVTNNIANAFEPLATWLRANNRQAFNSETGGGNNAGCVSYLGQQIAYLSQNSDVYLGFTSWAAGNFKAGYPLIESPTNNADGTWTDQLLVSQCIAPGFAATATSTSPTTLTTSTSTASPTSTNVSQHYQQCGGQGWTGPTTCASPYSCVYSNPYYSQCL